MKSNFYKNVLTLMSGTTIAQAIPITISPILTRIYTPEDFGILSLFVSISFILGSIANAKYEQVIMLPKSDEDAINIFALGFIITTLFSLTLFILVLIFNREITTILNTPKISIWLYFIPIVTFFIGFFNILKFFNSRKKYYKDIAKATVIKSITLTTIQLTIGFIKSGAMGLISGYIFSHLFANIKLLKNMTKNRYLLSKIDKNTIIVLSKKYIEFPKFALPSSLANTLSQHLINILISSFYSIGTLGFYSLISRVLGMPSALIGQSIGLVFYQEATQEKNKTGTIIKTFNATTKRLIIVALPIFTILFFTIKDIFVFVFGDNWIVTGEYAQITIPFFFVSFITSTLSTTYDIFKYLKVELIWQISLLSGSIITIFISYYLKMDFKLFLIILISFKVLMQIISFLIMKNLIIKEKK